MEVEANLYEVLTSKKDFEDLKDADGHLLVYTRGKFKIKYRGPVTAENISKFLASWTKRYTIKRHRHDRDGL